MFVALFAVELEVAFQEVFHLPLYSRWFTFVTVDILGAICSMNFTLNNLPQMLPYTSVSFHIMTLDNKLEMVRSSMLLARSIYYDFKREGQRLNESLFKYSEHLTDALYCFNVHKHVEKLLYVSMYAETYDMNGHAYVGDINIDQ